MKPKKLKITLTRSPAHRLKNHKACVQGLGLKRIHQTVIREDTPNIRGMIQKINYMVHVEEVN